MPAKCWHHDPRELESTFPPKRPAEADTETNLQIENASGDGFTDISLSTRRGEIVGIAGIVGNGQSKLLRALAGLDPFTGAISVRGEALRSRDLQARAAYMPADRHAEGLMMTLAVRENASVGALSRFTHGPLLKRAVEIDAVTEEFTSLDVKTPGLETPISSLSGGNQQKVVMARALMSKPAILLADEPTQGVDVGARAEIYRILREVSDSDVPVVVASSDAKELEGLCDRVIVMSRGEIVTELTGDEITEDAIVGAAMRADAHRRSLDPPGGARSGTSRRDRFLHGDYAPVAVLALVMLTLGAYVLSRNDRYLSAFNTTSVMMLVAALGFIALGQTICLMLGGIDLSVGPLAGFLVVIGSFYLTTGNSGTTYAFGLLMMLGGALATGLFNGALIRFGKFTPVAATLTAFIALQGLSFVLRDVPGGLMSRDVTDTITRKIGRVPVVFIALVVVTGLMELALRRSQWGLRLRAVGSHEESARKVGVRVGRTLIVGYMTASAFVFLGAIILVAQLGIGDPSQGEGYTLTSITAVVLGGTSLLGGRGTFVGTMLGAGLSVQVLNATTFLGLSQTWVYFFQGGLVVAAAIIFSQVRGRDKAAP